MTAIYSDSTTHWKALPRVGYVIDKLNTLHTLIIKDLSIKGILSAIGNVSLEIIEGNFQKKS